MKNQKDTIYDLRAKLQDAYHYALAATANEATTEESTFCKAHDRSLRGRLIHYENAREAFWESVIMAAELNCPAKPLKQPDAIALVDTFENETQFKKDALELREVIAQFSKQLKINAYTGGKL